MENNNYPNLVKFCINFRLIPLLKKIAKDKSNNIDRESKVEKQIPVRHIIESEHVLKLLNINWDDLPIWANYIGFDHPSDFNYFSVYIFEKKPECDYGDGFAYFENNNMGRMERIGVLYFTQLLFCRNPELEDD